MVNLIWRNKMNALHTAELVTRKEAASMLRVCLTTFDRLRLPSIRIRRRVFFRKTTLESWLSTNEQLKETSTRRNK